MIEQHMKNQSEDERKNGHSPDDRELEQQRRNMLMENNHPIMMAPLIKTVKKLFIRRTTPKFFTFAQFKELESNDSYLSIKQLLLPCDSQRAKHDFIEIANLSAEDISRLNSLVEVLQKNSSSKTIAEYYSNPSLSTLLAKALFLYSNIMELSYFRYPFSHLYYSIKEQSKLALESEEDLYQISNFFCFSCYLFTQEQYLKLKSEKGERFICFAGFLQARAQKQEEVIKECLILGKTMMKIIIPNIQEDQIQELKNPNFVMQHLLKQKHQIEGKVLFNALAVFRVVNISEIITKQYGIVEPVNCLLLEYVWKEQSCESQLSVMKKQPIKKFIRQQNYSVRKETSVSAEKLILS